MKKAKKSDSKKTVLGQGLLKGLREAVSFEKGQQNLRTTTLELPDIPPVFTKTQVKEVRIEVLNVSQPVFARMLGVSDGAVKAWEQGTNTPSGSAARLLQIARNAPETFKEIMVRIAK